MAFKRINTTDQNLQIIQDNVQSTIPGLTNRIEKKTDPTTKQITFVRDQISAPFEGGNFLLNVSLSSGKDNLVTHGLGRIPTLWVILKQTVNTTVWEVLTTALKTPTQAQRSSSDEFLNLWCGTDCIINLWVN